ncbi:Branched-chain amino acid aminotransferase/4-amino-4-deoxychorismate lyase [Pseudomonas syringae pv. actinidiae]|uniref:Branched-chain amino acid aminotransferase/4-amino-4-deoxychorismate lyase n=1 Tax=Pseudomonas syringae pv. actinidiae TaxID=103796 RepID=A0AAN4Q611_PSESF|nr:Branched-chain amino acid aminotransferase/4-amino-4-deoxychorismate lyase [Pseudomonas syringae pv. actinidiae]
MEKVFHHRTDEASSFSYGSAFVNLGGSALYIPTFLLDVVPCF